MMQKLQLPPFKEVELDYLAEYCKILRPIAVAIDRLQGQISCYYGELIPPLFAVLHDLQASNLRHTSPLLQAILEKGGESAEDLGLVAESETASSNLQDDEEDDFFVFSAEETQVQESQEITSHSKAELETLRFLEDTRKDLLSLQQYPLVKLLVLRFNTTLPSRAPVERLFSFAGIIFHPHRRRLTPEIFEKLVVLKGN
ncbi:hypothetical protein VZT92_014696 [Zoarces viviparus]|uniref:HAT C-terminal dimerisation domain-containing protein n=1 Tax=Zoarces viviparus TaxID=48416 RepID=A0AAW1F0U0_ZOAVI